MPTQGWKLFTNCWVLVCDGSLTLSSLNQHSQDASDDQVEGGKRQQPSSRPQGWLAAGIVVPVKLTVKQERYAKRCVGISRFVYNMAVSTHRFCRRNRLTWPSAHEMAREFNAAKREDYPFVTEVSKFVAQGAFRNFGNAVARWRDPEIKSGPPAIRRKNHTGAGSFLAASGIACIRYDGHRRIKLPYLGSVKLARELPEGSGRRSLEKFLLNRTSDDGSLG